VMLLGGTSSADANRFGVNPYGSRTRPSEHLRFHRAAPFSADRPLQPLKRGGHQPPQNRPDTGR
jgi:hypothetical protein